MRQKIEKIHQQNEKNKIKHPEIWVVMERKAHDESQQITQQQAAARGFPVVF